MSFESASVYGGLLDLLEGEARHYRALLSVLEGEKKAIVASNLDELKKTGREKEELLLKVRELEEQRQIMIKSIAEFLELSPDDLTITKLAELVEEPYSARFSRLRSELLPLSRTIQDMNEGNKALIEHSAELVRSAFSFLNNLIAADAVYYRSGRMQQNDQSGRVLCGEI